MPNKMTKVEQLIASVMDPLRETNLQNLTKATNLAVEYLDRTIQDIGGGPLTDALKRMLTVQATSDLIGHLIEETPEVLNSHQFLDFLKLRMQGLRDQATKEDPIKITSTPIPGGN